MKLRWLRPFIVLVAALIVSISNIVANRPIIKSLVLLLIVIIIFFIIGSIGTRVINRAISAKTEGQPVVPEEISEEAESAGEKVEE